MIGFPMIAAQKFINIFLNAGYIVAIYDQEENGKKNVNRILREILSPSTNIEYSVQLDNNYLMSIYIEPHINQKDNFYICAYSLIDLSVGANYLYETGSKLNDYDYGIQKIYQTIKIYNPKEVVCNVNTSYLSGNKWNYNREKLITDWEIQIDGRQFNYHEDQINKDIFKLSYQNQFLGTVFPEHGMLDPIQYLELEKYQNAVISYIILLEFAKSHRVDIITKISKPEILDNQDNLILTQNSVYQLNILPDKNLIESNAKNNSLVGILNQCSTAFGKRLFKQRILTPFSDRIKLEECYNKVDQLLVDSKYRTIEELLSKVIDIERLSRRLALKILAPNELYNFYESAKLIIIIFEYLTQSGLESMAPDKKLVEDFKLFIADIKDNIQIDRVYKYNIKEIERSIFKSGINQEIDRLDDEIEGYNLAFQTLSNELSKHIDLTNSKKKTTKKLGNNDEDSEETSGPSLINIYSNDRDGVYLECTKKRADNLRQNIHGKSIEFLVEVGECSQKFSKTFSISANDLEYKSISASSTSVRIVGKSIHNWSKKIDENTKKITCLAYDQYIKILESFDKKYHSVLHRVVNNVAELDIIKCHARNAIEMNLVRPTISEQVGNSYIITKGLRHPIVEKVQTKTPFISNDISLGLHGQKQILCYGYNAVGKTTLQKAICIAIIMAQSGGFVSAGSFEFNPYKYIFTRISNVDNLLKGQSSFMVEMLELKHILKNADQNSMVCIDELVASTERYSGISLVCSTIIELHNRGACMFMATHLHELSKMDRITRLDNLHIYHLEVHYDENTKELIYDRKLRDGSGSGLYGLEVARYLQLEQGFMDTAFQIRNELLGTNAEVFSAQQSNYNSNVYLVDCQICGYKPTHSTDIPLETHHIHFQSCASNTGHFKELGFHKNVEHNLVCLCRKCHTDVHSGLVNIKGYIATGNGVKLDFTKNEVVDLTPAPTKSLTKHIGRKKLTDNQVETIKSLSINGNYKNKKVLLLDLENIHNISIDYKLLSKIEKGEY
jgi:DNA mismatch repair protein MutS